MTLCFETDDGEIIENNTNQVGDILRLLYIKLMKIHI